MDDNYYWPTVSPNDLLPTDLPSRVHLIQHFNSHPSTAPPPAYDKWEDKDDRGESFRNMRDGTFSDRRKNTYLDSWGVNRQLIQMPISFLDITKHALNVESVFVLGEALRDGILSRLQELRVGQSEVWDMLSEESIMEPKDPTMCSERLSSAIVVHRNLKSVRLAGIDLPISVLRGDDETDKVLELAHAGLSAIHGLIIAAGLRNNQTLTNVDIRLNSESLGHVGLNALSHCFSNGAVMNLETLNGIIVDGMKKLVVHRSEEYELIWIARRIRASCNHRLLQELVLDGIGLNEKTTSIVGDMVLGMSCNIKLLDLSNNQTLCGIRCDRYGIWRGKPSTEGLDRILLALSSKNVHVDKLCLNGCALGSEGIQHISEHLSSCQLRVRQLELRNCSLLFEDLATLFRALGGKRLPELDIFSVRSVTAMASSSNTMEEGSSMMSGSMWGRTDLGSSAESSDSDCCTVECLDTRGNPVKPSSEVLVTFYLSFLF